MSKRTSKNTKGRKASVANLKSTKSRAAVAKEVEVEMLFDKQNYILMGVSLLVILVGFLLMSGGKMPSPDVWDESIIYSFRRITLAPFVVLSGLVIMIVAIFKK